MAAVAVLATALTAAGCGTATEDSAGKDDRRSSSSANTLTWHFDHIADFDGKVADVAVLARDDVWAVGTENNGNSNAHLLHYDGRQWKREPLPESLGSTTYPPKLEEIGEKELWLRPQGSEDPAEAGRWAKWDGDRWAPVPNPPPGNPGDFEAANADDVWTLTDERTAQHWDGTRWTATRLPHEATDLAVAGPDDVWAVGSRSTGPGTEMEGSGEEYAQPASMHWDGTSWKAVDTPQARFEEPLPPEPDAGLGQVFALDGGEVRAYGTNSFNHGEVENEPADQSIRLRWDGSKWAEQKSAPGGCALRTPVGQDGEGLFLDGNWYLTDDDRCVKIKRERLPVSTGARKTSNQSLWLAEIHRVPGTDDWLGAGHVQVNQSGDPFGAPVVVRLKRGG
ncbi:hypothetical protein GCM10010277_05840 [Streptomyces longisporoflavus]|uniref:hypothetical protein n=1 Tax=Streptomyces longisporoflavus TaxID=28044 RepID=UPI00167E7A4F|nr:hypothetical protein [Streptomyces longisporoflavus]GGV25074.1 hypothetical protein GCM10010277_05840 [Streptomyces longisporoflavus]